MIRLDLTREPQWLDFGYGVRLLLRPLTTSMMVAMRNDADMAALPETATDEDRGMVFAKALARASVIAWEGVGDADGAPAAVSPEAIDALLDIWQLFEAFQMHHVSKALLLDAEKKRLCARADWHFGGGDAYCGACEGACPDCPARLSSPRTFEGWQIWDLVERLGGQLRLHRRGVIGLDMGAALALADALGIDTLVAAEFLPPIEAVMVRKINEQIGDQDG